MSTADRELWAHCLGFPSYSISTLGRVRRDKTGRFLLHRALPRGHHQVTLSEGNRPTTVLVHRLVAMAFLPPPGPSQDCVCHRDDNPSNNRPDNLFWGTRPDNTNDMMSKQRQARGTRVAGAKLDQSKIADIRGLISQGWTQRKIAEHFGISQSNVSLIASCQTWGHVP